MRCGMICCSRSNRMSNQNLSHPKSQNIVKTIAGTGDMGRWGDNGPATSAAISNVGGIAVDLSGNVYFADIFNNAIRFVYQQTNIITTIAGMINGTHGDSGDNGAASSATLNTPYGLSLDVTNNLLYVADQGNHKIRLVTLSTGIITTYAGTGIQGSSGDGFAAINAKLNGPNGVAYDLFTSNVYIADTNNNIIRKVNSAGIISTFAGTGISGSTGDGFDATSATLSSPNNVATDRFGNVYIADTYSNKIRLVNSTGIITTFAGTGIYTSGPNVNGALAKSTHLIYPIGLTVDYSGNVYIADSFNYVVYRVTNGTGILTTYAGVGTPGSSGDNGAATKAHLYNLQSLAVDSSGTLYMGDYNRIREVITIHNSHQPSSQPTNPTYHPTMEPTFPTGNNNPSYFTYYYPKLCFTHLCHP